MTAGGPADGVLQAGDVITAVDGTPVTSRRRADRADPGQAGRHRAEGRLHPGRRRPATATITTGGRRKASRRGSASRSSSSQPHPFELKHRPGRDRRAERRPDVRPRHHRQARARRTSPAARSSRVPAPSTTRATSGPIGGIPQKLVGAKDAGAHVLPHARRTTAPRRVANAVPGLPLVEGGHAGRRAGRAADHSRRRHAEACCSLRPADTRYRTVRRRARRRVEPTWSCEQPSAEDEPARSGHHRRPRRRSSCLFTLLGWGVDAWTDWLWFDEVEFTQVFTGVLTTRMLLFLSSAWRWRVVVGGNLYLAYRLRPLLRAALGRAGRRSSATGCCSRRGSAPGSRVVARGDRPLRRPLRAEPLAAVDALPQRQPFGVERPAVRHRHRLLRLRVPVLALPARRRLHRDGAVAARRAGRALPLRRRAAAGRRRPDDHRRPGPPDRAGRAVRAAQGGRVRPGPAGAAARAQRPAPSLYGAGYTDINALLPAKEILAYISIVVGDRDPGLLQRGDAQPGLARRRAGACWASRRWRSAASTRGRVQTFTVKPSLRGQGSAVHRAEHRRHPGRRSAWPTRETTPYAASNVVPPASLATDTDVVPNIRLLDPAVVSETFTQLQQVRGFYDFGDKLDIDRYTVDGKTAGLRGRRARDQLRRADRRSRATGRTGTPSSPTGTASWRRRPTRWSAAACRTSSPASSATDADAGRGVRVADRADPGRPAADLLRRAGHRVRDRRPDRPRTADVEFDRPTGAGGDAVLHLRRARAASRSARSAAGCSTRSSSPRATSCSPTRSTTTRSCCTCVTRATGWRRWRRS